MRFLFLMLAALWGAGPAAAQPYSQSMAQCAGLYQAVEGMISRADRKAQLVAAAEAFSEAAVAQARAEGQADPEGWVETHRAGMEADWAGRGAMAAFSQDYRDWTAYCIKFARANGIDIRFD